MSYYHGERIIYIDEDGLVIGRSTSRIVDGIRAVALIPYYGCVKVLYEDGTEIFYFRSNDGVDQRHNYLLRQ